MEKEVVMRTMWRLWLVSIVAFGAGAPVLEAQTPPPIHGLTGTIATEGTIKAEHKAGNKIVVETEDGVEHVFDAAKDLLVHGSKDLSDLKPGTTVVVHYTPDATGPSAHEIDSVGPAGLRTTEGIVTKIDRGKREIHIRYDNGTQETLTLTARAAMDAGQDFSTAPEGTTRIVVYYSDEAGQKVAHYFKRKK
jgi:hypothetical protein